jgi:hypothetical protein
MNEEIQTLCNEILKRIPPKASGPPMFGMSVEESNAVHGASAYMKQLENTPETITPETSNKTLMDVLNEIKEKVPVIEPQNATTQFLDFYNKDEKGDNWGRVYNAFNREIGKILDEKLTYAKEKNADPIQSERPVDEVAIDEIEIAKKIKEALAKEQIEMAKKIKKVIPIVVGYDRFQDKKRQVETKQVETKQEEPEQEEA